MLRSSRPFFMICLCFLPLAIQAQAIVGTSDTLRLDFGYPHLVAKDDLTFTDENENDQIDPGEGCVISFTLVNESVYPANNIIIQPKELNELHGLAWAPQVKVGSLAAQGEKSISVSILAEDSLGVGTANFSFTILEGEAVESATVVYAVSVNQSDAKTDED